MRVTTPPTRLWRLVMSVITVAVVLILSPTRSSALTDLFELSQSIGSRMDMSGSTQLYGTYYSYVASAPQNIGFTFNFDGRNYTTFSVNTSGAFTLGNYTEAGYYPYYFPNSPDLADNYPFFAVYWLYVGYTSGTGRVHYKLSGTAPRRVLTIEWQAVNTGGDSYYNGGTFQARLYEGTNKIEYYYEIVPGYGYDGYYASIGIASSSTRWLNIWGNDITEYYTYPSGGYYFYRYTNSYPMTTGRLFSFNPCESDVTIVGNQSQGGTKEMKDGDVLLDGMTVQRGSSRSFTPFSLTNSDKGCDVVTYTASISGPAAADYSVPAGTIAIGKTVSPQIIFTPRAVGVREATIVFNTNTGQRLTYKVKAEGLTRMNWIGNTSEGGTSTMRSGDILLSNIEVNRGESRNVMPFRIANMNNDAAQSSATISYVLDDPLDEYSLAVPGGSVTGSATRQTGTISFGLGGSSTPVITFMPHPGGSRYGTGPQQATLTVTADGEQRVFTLNGFSVAPAMELSLDGTDVILSDRNFYRHTVACVGEEPVSLAFRMTNTNRTNVVIDGLDVYEVDSRVQQGSPKYPQLLDASGNLVRSNDYVLSLASGVAPIAENPQPEFPVIVGPGETRTFYLTFVGQRPGKRYARAFMRTNAVNFSALDLENFVPEMAPSAEVEGLMTMEFYGRGIGSTLSGSPEGGIDGLSLVFDPVRVGQSAESETTVYNTGECDMRINVDQARLSAGDVDEFELLEVFGGATKVGQDYLIAPGASATVKARFTPSRSGSRRATLMMATNDSTLGADVMSARGVYYLNLYGVGKADLRAHDLTLSPAVIDGPGSRGVVRLENTSSEVIEVKNAELGGLDVAEITVDGAKPWPALPFQLQPGDVLAFGVALNAASGSEPGVRTAELTFTYGSGDQVTASIEGLVGTRSLMATPSSLFEGMSVPVGSVVRRATVLSNQGTFPVTISDMRIEGPGAADYEVHIPARRVIDAGGFEVIEVVYAPTAAGSQGATLVIESNGTSGAVNVALSGTSMGTQQGGGSTGSQTIRGGAQGAGRTSAQGSVLELGQIAPNPVRSGSEIGFVLPEEGTCRVSLYGLDGRLVSVLHEGVLGAGTQSIRVTGERVAAGTYVLQLQQGDEIVTRPVRVVNW